MSRILYKKHKIISKKEDIANEFNNFFTNVGPNLANNIPLIPKNDTTIYDYLEEIIKHTMFLSPVDDKNVFTNYRPISLLPQFSKILEKIYNNRLDLFIDKCNMLSPSQYGFRSSMSTTEALLDLVEEISTSLENINILLEYLLT